MPKKLTMAMALALVSSLAWADRAQALKDITAQEIQDAVDLLAGPKFQGRGAGREGGKAAGLEISQQMKALGLEPAGPDGSYFQTFGDGMRNVAGIVRGSDPAVADEFVVIGAHYDHLGTGEKGGSLRLFGSRPEVHWGADDNASGTAAVLEIAEAALAARPRRSLLLILFDGEEMGLLGSVHYAASPLVPLEKTIAMINLDMVGRLEGRPVVVYGASTGGFEDQVKALAADEGLKLRFPKSVTPNSDHYPFFEKKIPAVHFFSGLHRDYHRPGDTAEKLDAEGAASIARLAFGLAWEIAETQERPAFAEAPVGMEPGDILGMLGVDTERLRGLRKLFGGESEDDRPKLGVTLENGLKVAEVREGSLAEKAGVQPGDVILALDGQAVLDVESLREALKALKPESRLKVQRGEKIFEIELHAKKAKTGWF